MPFGRKKVTNQNVNQDNVSMLASKALAEKRATVVRVAFRLRGTSSMLQHRWTSKAFIQMLGKMTGQPVPREAKDITAEYQDSWFRNTKGQLVIPCRLIKASMVEGAITTNGVVSKAELKRSARVLGYTAPVKDKTGKKLIVDGKGMSPDTRIAMNATGPDVRTRALVAEGWTADIVVQFQLALTPDQIVSALEGAGSSIGLCDWRPEKGGDHGCFSVEVLADKEIKRILDESSYPEEEIVIPEEYKRPFKAGKVDKGVKMSDSAKKALAVLRKNEEDNARANARGRGHTNGAPARVRRDPLSVLSDG